MSLRRKTSLFLALISSAVIIQGCSNPVFEELSTSKPIPPSTVIPVDYRYLIGPGDSLDIFVWRNPEVSTSVTVRPDGMINAPLVEDLKVSEKTPTEVARDVEKALAKYIKDPIVTVTIGGFIGPYREQVRVIGEASEPQGLPYSEDMTLLDLIISVGGLTEFADGNKAVLARIVGDDGEQQQYKQFTVRIEDLIQDGDLSANVDILPGDIIIIPEAWF